MGFWSSRNGTLLWRYRRKMIESAAEIVASNLHALSQGPPMWCGRSDFLPWGPPSRVSLNLCGLVLRLVRELCWVPGGWLKILPTNPVSAFTCERWVTLEQVKVWALLIRWVTLEQRETLKHCRSISHCEESCVGPCVVPGVWLRILPTPPDSAFTHVRWVTMERGKVEHCWSGGWLWDNEILKHFRSISNYAIFEVFWSRESNIWSILEGFVFEVLLDVQSCIETEKQCFTHTQGYVNEQHRSTILSVSPAVVIGDFVTTSATCYHCTVRQKEDRRSELVFVEMEKYFEIQFGSDGQNFGTDAKD